MGGLGGPVSGATEASEGAFRQGKGAELGSVQSEKGVPDGGGTLVPALESGTSRFPWSQEVLLGDDSSLSEMAAVCRPQAIDC